MISKSRLLVFAVVAVLGQSTFGQDIKEINENDLTKEEKSALGLLVGQSSYPVVYGKNGDKLPNRMRVRGVIEEVTFVPFACGLFCWSGTAKIRLTQRIKGYEPTYVYVAILCLIGKREEFVNKFVDIRVTKLFKKEDVPCGSIVNAIDSDQVAFYKFEGDAFNLKVYDLREQRR